MDLQMSGQLFENVRIPLLWGTRAVIQEPDGHISVIDLKGEAAKLEILADEPAPGIDYRPTEDGFEILSEGKPLYHFNPQEQILTGIYIELPECQLSPWEIRIGSSTMTGNTIKGYDVGIAVTRDGFSIGAPMPESLADLVI